MGSARRRPVFPQLADVSLAKLDRLSLPVLMLLGRQDYATPSIITAGWMGRLRAPKETIVWMEHTAHLP